MRHRTFLYRGLQNSCHTPMIVLPGVSALQVVSGVRQSVMSTLCFERASSNTLGVSVAVPRGPTDQGTCERRAQQSRLGLY